MRLNWASAILTRPLFMVQRNDLGVSTNPIVIGYFSPQKDGLIRFIGFTAEGINGPMSQLIDTGEFDVIQIQYNFIFQHPYDPIKHAGVLYEAEGQGMGIALMRAFTGRAFSKWLKRVAPGLGWGIDPEKVENTIDVFKDELIGNVIDILV